MLKKMAVNIAPPPPIKEPADDSHISCMGTHGWIHATVRIHATLAVDPIRASVKTGLRPILLPLRSAPGIEGRAFSSTGHHHCAPRRITQEYTPIRGDAPSQGHQAAKPGIQGAVDGEQEGELPLYAIRPTQGLVDGSARVVDLVELAADNALQHLDQGDVEEALGQGVLG